MDGFSFYIDAFHRTGDLLFLVLLHFSIELPAPFYDDFSPRENSIVALILNLSILFVPTNETTAVICLEWYGYKSFIGQKQTDLHENQMYKCKTRRLSRIAHLVDKSRTRQAYCARRKPKISRDRRLYCGWEGRNVTRA